MACGVRGCLRARARPRRLRGRQRAAARHESSESESERRRRTIDRSLRRNRRCRLDRAGGRAESLDRRIRERQRRRDDLLRRVGSGGGREQFISGGVAFAGSDTPLSEEEGELGKAIKRCEPGELIEVPDYISPIAIIYNLPGVEELKLDPETLAKIFNQEIENWNDPEIAKENPDVELPDTRIVPVNRSDESGTTENFTDYLSKVVPERLDPRSER